MWPLKPKLNKMKMGIECLSKYFSKEDMKMAYSHIEIFSMLLIIQGFKFKTQGNITLSDRRAIIKK